MRHAAMVLASIFLAILAAATTSAVEPERADAAAITVKSCTGRDVRLSAAEKTMLNLHNRKRASRNLPRLCIHPALQRAASAHSQDMVRKDYFAHGTFDRRLKKIGYPCRACAENIAPEPGRPSPNRVFDGWMQSPSHRSNIRDRRYDKVGIGAATGNFRGAKKTLWTVAFGTRR
jgi:uncharacterized protein YkwD